MADTLKTELIGLLQRLPDNASLDRIMDLVIIWERLKVSDQSIWEGRVFTHEEVMERMKEWFRRVGGEEAVALFEKKQTAGGESD